MRGCNGLPLSPVSHPRAVLTDSNEKSGAIPQKSLSGSFPKQTLLAGRDDEKAIGRKKIPNF
jgi:hypothetical protein